MSVGFLTRPTYFRKIITWCLTCGMLGASILSACNSSQNGTDEPKVASELVLYNWEDDMPTSILDAFSEEYGIKVGYLIYASQEEGIEQIRLGQHADVMVMDSGFIPMLIQENLIRELNYRNLINFKNISPNFRGLSYDPENIYSIPYSWGVTALVVRSDLIPRPVTSWRDLWDPMFEDRIGIWVELRREVISLTLKSLGYSANSEDPQEIQTAIQKLIELKPHIKFLEDFDPAYSSGALASGEIILAMGYTGDILEGQRINTELGFIYPEDGALLWGDTFVIPATTRNQYTAELFINYLLRPEVAAEIANYNSYASANESALALIEPMIREDPIIYPPLDELRNAEILLPLSPAGQAIFDQAWEQFLRASPER